MRPFANERKAGRPCAPEPFSWVKVALSGDTDVLADADRRCGAVQLEAHQLDGAVLADPQVVQLAETEARNDLRSGVGRWWLALAGRVARGQVIAGLRDVPDEEGFDRALLIARVHAAVGLPEVDGVVVVVVDGEEAVAAVEREAEEVELEFAAEDNVPSPGLGIGNVFADVVAAGEVAVNALEVVQSVEGGFFGPFDDECAVLEPEVADYSLREVEGDEGDIVRFKVVDYQGKMHGNGHAPS